MSGDMSFEEFEALRRSRKSRASGSKYRSFVRSLGFCEVLPFTDYHEGANLAGVRSSILSAAQTEGVKVLTTIDDDGRLLVARPPSGDYLS